METNISTTHDPFDQFNHHSEIREQLWEEVKKTVTFEPVKSTFKHADFEVIKTYTARLNWKGKTYTRTFHECHNHLPANLLEEAQKIANEIGDGTYFYDFASRQFMTFPPFGVMPIPMPIKSPIGIFFHSGKKHLLSTSVEIAAASIIFSDLPEYKKLLKAMRGFVKEMKKLRKQMLSADA